MKNIDEGVPNKSWSPIYYYGTKGRSPIVLICEHAAFDFPHEYDALNLDPTEQTSHIVGDVGALSVAKGLAIRLQAPLVHGGVSRLLYDCNRPMSAKDAIPSMNEVYSVPGNKGLSVKQRQARFDLIHQPFHQAVAGLITAQHNKTGQSVIVVTVHSFTPIFMGVYRPVQIGFLHDDSTQLSELSCQIERRRGVFACELNQPYDASDGVTYTLRKHAKDHHMDSTMIEIRNDLIDTHDKAESMAAHLAETLNEAMGQLDAKREMAT